MLAAYYLDTSALLPLLMRGAPGHAWLNALCDPATGNLIAIAEITEAEIAAALNQLVRGGVLKRNRCATALALFWD
jgi:glucose-6-phosphate dehydrogenase assembly protein OpcA